jgi:hypothetical protein
VPSRTGCRGAKAQSASNSLKVITVTVPRSRVYLGCRDIPGGTALGTPHRASERGRFAGRRLGPCLREGAGDESVKVAHAGFWGRAGTVLCIP